MMLQQSQVARQSDEFVDRRIARIDQVLRHSGKIKDANILHVDTGTLIERGKHFLKSDWARVWLLAVSVGRTDDLASLQSAPGQHRGIRLWPVIAAVHTINFR